MTDGRRTPHSKYVLLILKSLLSTRACWVRDIDPEGPSTEMEIIC